MNEKLSERLWCILDDARVCTAMTQRQYRALSEALSEVKRVEDAPVAKVRGKVGDVCMIPVSHAFCGKRVRLLVEDAK